MGVHSIRQSKGLVAWLFTTVMVCAAIPTWAFGADTTPAKRAKGGGAGAKAYPPVMSGCDAMVYKTVGDVKLNAYVFKPADWKASDHRPAIVFFFGGGWTGGSPTQFEPHCRRLAELGMVAITCDYRVKSRQDVQAVACVSDAKSAIRWTRSHAAELGIDPDHIAAAGGSAGGHIAACTATIDGFDEPKEDAKVSSKPNALVLFNPALDISSLPQDRTGVPATEISPQQHVKAGLPPTIIFHGKADTTVPYASAESFEKAMKAAGNDCKLMGYEGQVHGFFNQTNLNGVNMQQKVLDDAVQFLREIKYAK